MDGDALTYRWSWVSRPAGSAAALSNALAVNPTFVADRPGAYVAKLIVNDGTVDSTPDTVAITTLNSPPVANAGPDQAMTVASTVSLDARASSDVDGDALTYRWSWVSRPAGSTAALSDSAMVNPTFVADRPGTYVAQLIVNDGAVDSAPDTVTITTLNSPPVANAGPDQAVPVASTVSLNGSGSSDVDGDALTYHWSWVSRPVGSTATLSNSLAVNPTFVADQPGTYVAQLIVNDGTVDSAPDMVTIRVEEPTVPTAVDSRVGVSLGLMTYDRRTLQTKIQMTITNTSAAPIYGPVWVVIKTISSPDVTLVGASGTTSDGYLYLNVTSLLGDDRLDPGETISTWLSFSNRLRRSFSVTYSIRGLLSPLPGS